MASPELCSADVRCGARRAFPSLQTAKVVTSRACQQSRPFAATLRAFGLCMRHGVRRTVPGAALVEDSGSYAPAPSAAGAATADGDVAAGGASCESNTIPSVPSPSCVCDS